MLTAASSSSVSFTEKESRQLKKILLGLRQLQSKYHVKQKRCTQANLSDSLRALSAKDS